MQLLFRILAIAGSAMFAGIMLAIGVIICGYWEGLPPAEFLDWFVQKSSLIMRTIRLIVVPNFLELASVIYSAWKVPSTRWLWLASITCIIVVFGFTMAYFVSSNMAFSKKSVVLNQVIEKLNSWLLLHKIRIAFALAASVLGIVAINR